LTDAEVAIKMRNLKLRFLLRKIFGGSAYTARLDQTCDARTALKFVERLPDGWFLPIKVDGRECFVLYWKMFDTEPEANSAVDEFPQALGFSPSVVRFRAEKDAAPPNS